MEALLYGADGKSGILGRANDLSNRPMNDNMRQGINNMAAYYNSPQRAAMMNQLMGPGSALMNAPIAGNPYTRGQASPGGSMGFGGGYAPPQFNPQAQQQPQQGMSTGAQASAPVAQQGQPQISPELMAFLQRMYQSNTNSGG